MDPVELGEPDKVPAVYRAERAVIEAAEAWWDDDDRSHKYAQHLGLAVEALQAARGE